MTADELTSALKQEAARLGFDFAGACEATSPDGFDRLRRWIAEGRHASMDYMAARIEAYAHPENVLPGAKSLLVLGVRYGANTFNEVTGNVARYARSGVDYHDVIRNRLKRLSALHRELSPDGKARGVVDTAPLLEREFAQKAGLGFIGKNTCLIHPEAGSWLFLAGLLSTERLSYDAPLGSDVGCGDCRRCLDACPTGALCSPYTLDARRCISYLTIEHRGAFTPEQARRIGDRVFGCDQCQEVCPWNKVAPDTSSGAIGEELAARSELACLSPVELLSLDEDAFSTQFRKTSFARAGHSGLLRNAATVLGNCFREASVAWSEACGCSRENAVGALKRAAQDDDPVVRQSAERALREVGEAANPSA